MSLAALRKVLGEGYHSPHVESRVALGLLLAAMVEADGVVRPVERAALFDNLKEKFGLSFAHAEAIVSGTGQGGVEARELAALLGMALASDRAGEIRSLAHELWNLALCDGELHERERALAHHLGGLMASALAEAGPDDAV